MPSRRDFLKAAGLGAAAAILPGISRAAKAADKPNLLFIGTLLHLLLLRSIGGRGL